MKVLITGANGFIGKALRSRLASGNKVIGVDITGPADGTLNIAWEQADLADRDLTVAICKKYSPDVVIHCAGIAHQKIGAVDSATYMRVNSEVTENLAKAAVESNPGVCFIFLSSVSVYGEHPQITQNKKDTSRKGAKAQRGEEYPQITQSSQIKRTKTYNDDGIGEDGGCWPSSDYAVSKLDAERRLIALYDDGKLHNLVILRLAPVYDRSWSLNLDRRVFAPGKVAYLRFGSGSQRMSALARLNLVEFIVHILQSADYADFRGLKDGTGLDSGFRRNDKKEGGNDKRRNSQILNVCDAESYEFNRIIGVFKKSGVQPNRPVISVPLSVVWLATRIAGVFFSSKREWIYSCYDKLASDLVFDNRRMMGTGFAPQHSLETIFNPQITPVPSARATPVRSAGPTGQAAGAAGADYTEK